MSWFVGQEVGVLKEAGIFKVLAIEKESLLLEDENGFTYRHMKLEVVIRQPINTEKISSKDLQAKSPTVSKKVAPTKHRKLPFIDLHAEELSIPSHLSAHDVFLAQISAFKNFCNGQAQRRNPKFIVIHGAGEGKLKQEIRQICNGAVGISIHDAQWSNGAVGASQIELLLGQFKGF
ncbi:MAG: hypothetical protein LW839_02120 [Cryomorphaceae bacterium]|jgi:hypothetical protein|nr:hypothetical protein [Cryomorphaceae bacterium]